MKNLFKTIAILTIVFLFSGCGVISKNYVYTNSNVKDEINNIEISLIPINKSMIAGYSAFILKLNNDSDNDIEIDWNKTYFIDNGRTNGTFMFEGIVYKDRNNPKTSDIVFQHSIFSKAIYPNNLVVFNANGSLSSWGHEGMGIGTHGVYLTLLINGKSINKKIYVDVKEQ